MAHPNRNKNFTDKLAKALVRRQQLRRPIKPKDKPPQRVGHNLTRKASKVTMGQHSRPQRDSVRKILDNVIFFTGSIGDVLALESFMSDETRRKTTKFYYATQKQNSIQSLFQALPSSGGQEHAVIWNDFSNFWCFFNKDQCLIKLSEAKTEPPMDFVRSQDYSILSKFDAIMNDELVYNGSSFLKYKLTDIDLFNLPQSFFAICPYSTDKRIRERDFTSQDWDNCIRFLKAVDRKGVVLNVGSDFVPDSDQLINLSNKTDIRKAVEVVKAADGYIGIDSSMSVLAAKLFDRPNLMIKSINPHCYHYAKCYYAPHKDFSFMVKAITVPHDLSQNFIKRLDRPLKRITLNVCQGVGDVFWVYQKFAPHVDEIEFSITTLNAGAKKVQSRATDFLYLLPKVKKVSSRVTTPQEYEALIDSRIPMQEIMDSYANGVRTFNYSCNRALEEGCRIEHIDPAFSVEETVDVKMRHASLNLLPKKYVTVYVSGSTTSKDVVQTMNLWSVKDWRSFIKMLYKKYNLNLPVLVIGASYDRAPASELQQLLAIDGFDVKIQIDAPADEVAFFLKNSLLYIGYQSGLNVLADNFDVAQVMLYFPYLHKMMYSWCKASHISDGTFNAATFDKSPESVLDNLHDNFLRNTTAL